MQMRSAESGGSVYVITTFVFRTDHLNPAQSFVTSDACEIGTPGERQVLVDERDRHAAFAHTAGYPLDRTVTNVARTKHARKARLKRKRLAIENPPGQVSSGVDIAFGIALQGWWKP